MSVRDSKRYFWLKLKDDFFDDDAIEWLEEQPNGKEYVLFYLKLCLKSLKHDCCLIRTVGNMLIPYDAKKLGELTRTKEDTVIVALELLKRIGLVDIQENGALFMAKVSEMIGSETNAAARMRKFREKAKEIGGVNNVRPMLQNCSPELEIEKEIEIDKKDIPAPAAPIRVSNAVIGEEFEKLWGMLPKKRGDKRKALNAYTKARKAGTTMADVMIGINAYKAAITVEHTPDEYIMQAATFFTGRRWLDDWTPHRARDRNAFNNIETHEYDMDALEAELLGAGGEK